MRIALRKVRLKHSYKRCFTLIEVMIVLVLIALSGSVLLLRSREMIERYQFRYGAEHFLQCLNLSRELALLSNNDVLLHLSCEQGHLYGKWMRRVDQASIPNFNAGFCCFPITHFSVDGQEMTSCDLLFCGRGWFLEEYRSLSLFYKRDLVFSIDLTATPFFTGTFPSPS